MACVKRVPAPHDDTLKMLADLLGWVLFSQVRKVLTAGTVVRSVPRYRE
jgi:electron transfer flavoprotein alpha/beta subunit